jgi:hypothetical protein
LFTLVVPFHADIDRLPRVLGAANEAHRHGISEILFCHNGPNPVPRLELPPNSRLLHTDAKGIGAGYRLGIAEARQQFVVLSASDLPFGFTDVDEFRKRDGLRLAIGSKAHPQTEMPGYSLLRRTATYIFWLVRRAILGKDTPKDSQGTILIETGLAKQIVDGVASDDYFFSLELLTHCIRAGVVPVELPVRYEGGEGPSAVNLVSDTIAMVRKTWQLR